MAHDAAFRDNATGKELCCDSCGKPMRFDPATQGLRCEPCTRTREIPRRAAPAATSFDPRKPGDGKLEVSCVVPLRVTAAQALDAVARWMRQEGLPAWAGPSTMTAAFVPVVWFDLAASASYEGRRGKHVEKRTAMRGLPDGNGYAQETVSRETKWEHVRGAVSRESGAVRVLAMERHANPHVALAIDSVPDTFAAYDEALVSGFDVTSPDLDLARAYARAKDAVAAELSARAKREIGGDEQEVLGLEPHITRGSFRVVLVPVYIGRYEIAGKSFAFAVDGASATVRGAAPDTPKKAFARWLGVAGGWWLAGSIVWTWQIGQYADTVFEAVRVPLAALAILASWGALKRFWGRGPIFAASVYLVIAAVASMTFAVVGAGRTFSFVVASLFVVQGLALVLVAQKRRGTLP